MRKVVFITGASSGIGRAIGEYLIEKNYVVYGTSRNPKRIEDSKFPLVALDVLQSDTVFCAIKEVVDKEGRIDVLINNAGKGIMGAMEDIAIEEVENGFNTNFLGPIRVMKAVLPFMRKQKTGLIINITSLAGYSGLPFRSVYSSSKGALELLTESVSMEVKNFGVNVVSVAPGSFATNIASGRYYTPVSENSAYKEAYGKNLKVSDDYVDQGLNPLVMAKAIHKIIETKKPKLHYKIGAFMERFSVVLKRALPDRVYEKLIMNHYKL
ncbi:SDR family oxidoreductase [Tenacibaculum jejuense]|uniref:Short-chain dehydrogenase/reductase SDR n=1 Tax=Tenacibaculum jejuense TaxID=584609 RepID=A0A238UEY8_9FLAO|nr:SDR family oxidoreductase [Tenacibaculum jejuense]SNR16970.1 Short-chain dehydrogenase/reductase SDR [Tenacibaculum jejuense]